DIFHSKASSGLPFVFFLDLLRFTTMPSTDFRASVSQLSVLPWSSVLPWFALRLALFNLLSFVFSLGSLVFGLAS
ncbi:MAG: hypothetical protein KAJ09_11250, partial [Deltaproteobacteria bacterium]|nr:hypothetical protein [Deltaproteobacteria bacterium]